MQSGDRPDVQHTFKGDGAYILNDLLLLCQLRTLRASGIELGEEAPSDACSTFVILLPGIDDGEY